MSTNEALRTATTITPAALDAADRLTAEEAAEALDSRIFRGSEYVRGMAQAMKIAGRWYVVTTVEGDHEYVYEAVDVAQTMEGGAVTYDAWINSAPPLTDLDVATERYMAGVIIGDREGFSVLTIPQQQALGGSPDLA